MLKIQEISYFVLSVLIVNFIHKVAALPSDARKCHCVLLKNCDSFTSFIDRYNDMTYLTSTIAEATCKFDGSNIYVCCPKRTYRKRHVKVKTKLDYLDDITGQNCPPSFGKEHNYDEYLKQQSSNVVSSSEEDYSNQSGERGVNKDDSAMCDNYGNCGRIKFPTDEVKPHITYYNFNYDNSQEYENEQKFTAPLYPFHSNRDHNHNVHHLHHHLHHHNLDPPPNKQPNIPAPPAELTPVFSVEQNGNSETCGFITQQTSAAMSSEVYPWITRLAYLNTTSRGIRYRCLGTIVTEQHVLTAAHCVDNLVRDLRLIFVRVGDDVNFDDFKIIETLIHPNYNEPLFNNDVSLIRLARTRSSRVPFNSICLPQTDSIVSVGDSGIVAGWSEQVLSNAARATIRYINLPVMNNTECAIRYAKYSENFENSIVITPSEFCAQAEEPMNDVCEGDSGGPFMVRSPSGSYTLLGIVAFGPKTNCGQSNLPGVYMRVSSYVEWIQSNIF